MAGGLNNEFLRDPVAFMRRYSLNVVDQNMPTGVHKVGFYADLAGRVLLKKFIGVPGRYQHPFDCYFLQALPDNANLGGLLSVVAPTWFFTSTLSGCQFIATGSKHAPSVQHNNCLSGAADAYDNLHTGLAAQNVLFRVHNGGSYNIDVNDIGNVFGVYIPATGWDFYFQKIERDSGAGNRRTITVTKIL